MDLSIFHLFLFYKIVNFLYDWLTGGIFWSIIQNILNVS